MNREMGSLSALASDADAAIELAGQLLVEARQLQTPAEKRQQAELDRMIGNPNDKATLVEMTDQAFRTHTPARVADQLTYLLDVQGIPRFFSPVEQAMLQGFRAFGEFLPGVTVPMVKEQMRRETANVILPAQRDLLAKHLTQRQQQGVEMNLNLLGESLVGEMETRQRMDEYYDVLRMPEVSCLSVKLTTLYCRVSAIARRHTIRVVSDRLERLYRLANRQADSKFATGKFVYLDMEEYRDLHLTADIIRETLGRKGLQNTAAGLALQAYIPDSYDVMRQLIDWSAKRVADGGSPLTIRLVKGANMEMERVEASLAGFNPAPYATKLETDANYKRMLRELIAAASAGHVRVGIASHNLFDIALAVIWIQRAGCKDAVQFEMLEGMANHQRRAITARDQRMLLYAPACEKSDFLFAIGYLIRRLDENTGQENFLRHSYRLTPESDEFQKLASNFRTSLEMMDSVSSRPRRIQDRLQRPSPPAAWTDWRDFVNEPDTDWSLPHNVDWIESLLETDSKILDEHRPIVTPVLAPSITEPTDSGETHASYDVSRPDRVSCHFRLAGIETSMQAVDAASKSTRWQSLTIRQHHEVLRRAAQNLRQRRGELIVSMVADAGKTVSQGDPEVSEAIDFCEFYPLTALPWESSSTVKVSARGVVAVITPWNFPLAIPCGGIAAALAAGNSVILKPATQTLLPAWLLCHAFWDAGVPREALQFLPCADHVAETALVRNQTVDTVILTGGTSTAKRMLSVRPDLHLLAETGGKNATIVTAMADRDLAIKHVVASAMGHSGQKCSATSLLLLEREVFEDPTFRGRLADAVNSLHVGSAWDLDTDVTPLVCPPNDELTRGLNELDPGESWLVVPEHVDGNPTLYRPGIKWNVRPGSFSHTTELFGPVLSVMPFGRLEEAISIVRSTGYGLTSGLESLDKREIDLWKESIPAGNLYINRPTTGAIVLRQPFGGVGLSAYGPGVKAGGCHYVLALCHIEDLQHPENQGLMLDVSNRDRAVNHPHDELDRLIDWINDNQNVLNLPQSDLGRLHAAALSQREAVANEFSGESDTFELLGQHNWRRYQSLDGMLIRIGKDDFISDVLIAVSACIAVGTSVAISIAPKLEAKWEPILDSLADGFPDRIDPITETTSALIERIKQGRLSRLRCFSPLPFELAAACGEAFVTVVCQSIVSDGRIECLRYLNEQSISYDYHRYGNLGRTHNAQT
jgi:RHH-type transcriptional regulator, proline utilization regulon repressor / proline dehydrogenase / delta 1-pyrroline-5-carboxylate dehydrogenase